MPANDGQGPGETLPPDPVPDLQMAWISVMVMFHGLVDAGASLQEAAMITAAWISTQGQKPESSEGDA